MKPVEIIGRDGCVACLATRRAFEKAGIPIQETNVDNDPNLAQALRAKGYSQLPVVRAQGETWTGYDPRRIKAICREHGTVKRRGRGR